MFLTGIFAGFARRFYAFGHIGQHMVQHTGRNALCAWAALGMICGLTTAASAGETSAAETGQSADYIGGKPAGVPFRTVFPISGPGPNWWRAEYDHPAEWLQTGWRKDAVFFSDAGVEMSLTPSSAIIPTKSDATDASPAQQAEAPQKAFVSGQMQRRGWYGYGRYEVIMRPAIGKGLISAFYFYTGPHFGHTHEEASFEFLGKDSSRVYLNRYRDGERLERAPWLELGFNAAKTTEVYTIDWSEEAIVWSAGDTELFRLTGADQVPRPPVKIYFDLWAGGEKQAHWAGVTPEDTEASALVQCVSFTPQGSDTPSCSALMAAQ